MKDKRIVLGAFLGIFIALATMSFKKMANPLIGKWQILKKIEQKIQDGNVMERFEKNYKPGKKTYEFTSDNKLLITDNKDKEKKKYVVEGSSLYIGKEKTANNMYTIISKGNTVVLSRTKTKTKEGKTTLETDELTLEKIN